MSEMDAVNAALDAEHEQPSANEMTIQQVKSFVALTKEKSRLAKELEAVKDKLELLEPAIIAKFADMGIQRLHVDGKTVHLARQFTVRKQSDASGATTALICERLQEYGFGSIVKPGYQPNSLKSAVIERYEAKKAEYEEAGEQVPVDLTPAQCIPEALARLLYIGDDTIVKAV